VRILLVSLILALITGFAGAVVGYLATGGDAQWSAMIAGVLGSLLTIAFGFLVAGGES
jgi:hypothetical protein